MRDECDGLFSGEGIAWKASTERVQRYIRKNGRDSHMEINWKPYQIFEAIVRGNSHNKRRWAE